ncbi:hypothetical protein DM02DRAFT_539505, partial [Periconia macrospinosa]
PVTRREFKVRAYQAFDIIFDDIFLFPLYHDVCAVIFLSIGLDESWEWPPFFGPITEAYTMRRYWSHFWQRTIYRSFGTHSSLFLRKVLRIENQRTAFARIVNAFGVFGLSAIMHAMVSAKEGGQCAWGRSMLFWIYQPCAFMLEEAVQAVWGRLKRGFGVKESGLVKGLQRVVGYCWVCAWLLWIAPTRTNSLVNCGIE